MGRVLLICRLVLRDLRRHPAEAAMFLLAVTAATATLSLGLAVNGATDTLYQKTRAATAGPDLVAVSGDTDAAALAQVSRLEHAPGAAGHGGPYFAFDATVRAHGYSVWSEIEARDAAPAALDRPLVTSGGWLRPGGAVLDRGFADALGVHVGDHVSVGGRTFPVVGIAITAATAVYPWEDMAQGAGPSHLGGLIWLTPADARAAAAADPQSSGVYVLDLKLSDPGATQAFTDPFKGSAVPVNFASWQSIANQDSIMLRNTEPMLVVGGWLLAVAAIVGVTALVAGRAAQQTRRVGLLKAVGATPGLVATVMLAHYLLLTALATGLGLLIAVLSAPLLTDPGAGLLDTPGAPTSGAIASVLFLAALVALFSTLGPTVRAARTSTVHALADTAHAPQYRAGLTALSAHLPTALLLGVRLIMRRPRRAALTVLGTASAGVMVGALVTLDAQPDTGLDFGLSTLSDVRGTQDHRVLLAVTLALGVLCAVNTMAHTWSTALEARRALAVARTLGATPGQVVAALCAAQLLPALPGALLGIAGGLGLYWVFSVGSMATPPASWLLAALLATLLAIAALTALPAWIHTRRPAADILDAETA